MKNAIHGSHMSGKSPYRTSATTSLPQLGASPRYPEGGCFSDRTCLFVAASVHLAIAAAGERAEGCADSQPTSDSWARNP